MTIWRAMRGPGPRCFDADAVWIDKMNWIGDSTGPTSAGKLLKIEPEIPLAHTQSLISWSRWLREAPLQRGCAYVRRRRVRLAGDKPERYRLALHMPCIPAPYRGTGRLPKGRRVRWQAGASCG